MRELSLFSGAGGGLLATKHLLGWETIGYVENNDYCQRVIAARIKDGLLDDAPIYGDVKAFIAEGYAKAYQGLVDVVAAGFPCQPFSVAGKQRGAADPRNMWPATLGVIRTVRPAFAFLENVPGLLANPYWGTILGDLAEAGYNAEWCVLGAGDVGAPHRRKRLWALAHANRNRSDGGREQITRRLSSLSGNRPCNSGGDMAHAQRDGFHKFTQDVRSKALAQSGRSQGGRRDKSTISITGSCARSWWDTDPADLADAKCEQQRGHTSGRTSRLGRRQRKPSKALQDTGQGRGEEIRVPTTQSFVGRVVDGVADKLGKPRPALAGYIPRVATGVRDRVARLKALGNGQVPATAARAWEILSAAVDRNPDAKGDGDA